MRKHVLFIVENNPVPQDVRVWNEAIAAQDFGYDVTVISPVNKKASLKYEKIDGISIYRHYIPFEADTKLSFLFEYGNAIIWEFLLTLWIYIKKPFHFIHSANPPDHVFIIAVFFKFFGVKYIFDHHDICPENYVAKFGRKDLFYKSLLIMEKLTFKVADVVISTNESYKKIALDRGDKNNEDVFVVRNGPDLSSVIFMPPNYALKDSFDYLVTYVGTIGNQEGMDNLLRSVDYIVHKKGIKNIKFIIVGTGTNWQEMVDMSKAMGLTKHVYFTGYVSYKDFYEILSTADVCVNPEFRNEFTDKSTMIKIMDYMVFGKPIVQFYTTEGKVTAGDAALYVEDNNEIKFANAIIKLLNNPERRRKMGDIACERIHKELNWNLQKPNLKKAYIRLENR